VQEGYYLVQCHNLYPYLISNLIQFFTVSIGGMVTLLNTSGQPLHPGDLVEWCFYSPKGTHLGKRQKTGPRRVGITLASVSSPKIIGRVISFAKQGETLDVLLKQ
tara:strand:- start:5877 stop:6191 length:315 start_codon:yes stop_codon:yes gene_type:complete